MPDERTPLWRVTRWSIGALFEAGFRVRYSGLEHLPAGGAAVLAYNHVSVLDPIGVGLGAYRRGRTIRFLAVADVFDTPFLGWALRRLAQVPLHRGMGDRRALDAAIGALREGGLVALAPEGTVGTGEALQRGHSGTARIALAGGATIVPVGVWGTQRRWPRAGLRLTRPLRPELGVAFGPAVPAEGDPASAPDVDALTARIMEALAVQVDAARALAG